MNTRETAIKMFNNLPKGAKKTAAIIYKTSAIYFSQILYNPRTDETALIKAIEAMCEASKQITDEINVQNKMVQETGKKILKSA